MSFMYYDCMYHYRPMYIDSTNTQPPAGDQPVATELRKYVEPLLKVMCCRVCPCSLSPNKPDGSIQKLAWPFWGRVVASVLSMERVIVTINFAYQPAYLNTGLTKTGCVLATKVPWPKQDQPSLC